MAAAYPATVDVTFPEKVARDQSIIRVVIWCLMFFIGGIVSFLVTIVAPIVIALRVRTKGGEKYIEEDSPEFIRYASLLVGALAYLYFLTDEEPGKAVGSTVKVEFKASGNPTWVQALIAPILLIPHAIALGILGLAFIVILPWTAVVALANEVYPRQFFDFVVGYLRWETRVIAYLFSLTREYPPFAF